MTIDKTLYTEESIESLNPLEFTRLRPQVYCGDTTYSTQLLVEIFSNAVDEYRLSHGSKIEVNIDKDIVFLRDYGQGFIPNSFRDDGKTILEAAFSVLNTSGKYREDGAYEGTSLGSFGIGSKLCCFLSHYLEVETWRDGQTESIFFEEGLFKNRHVGKSNEPTGTYVRWQPSEEFFTHTEVEINEIKKLFTTVAALCPGLTIELNDNGNKITYFSKNGINDLIDEAVKGKELIKNRFIMNFDEGKNKLDLVMTYTSNYSLTIIPYVNTGLTTAGPHITQIKSLLTREFNKFFRDKKWLKDKDENLTGDDLQEGLYIIFNITASNVAYNAQVKTTITKLEMTPFTSVIAEELRNWMNYNEKEIKQIADKALSARKARLAAQKARETVRNKAPKEKGLKAKLALSNKFTDCANKNPAERNLLLVEGQSAATSAIEARNTKTDCIYQLRGKIISPLKTEINKILSNQEMSDIINVIGAGFDSTFDVNKMNFNKIVITSDQDSDGFDIELLLITFFFKFMRPLVEAGKLYRAVTPLYIMRQKGQEYYAFSDKELEEWKASHNGKFELVRAKGLGELNPIDLHKVCFEKERYKRITVSDADKAMALLEVLQGPQVEPRKQYIYDNAVELGFHFE